MPAAHDDEVADLDIALQQYEEAGDDVLDHSPRADRDRQGDDAGGGQQRLGGNAELGQAVVDERDDGNVLQRAAQQQAYRLRSQVGNPCDVVEHAVGQRHEHVEDKQQEQAGGDREYVRALFPVAGQDIGQPADAGIVAEGAVDHRQQVHHAEDEQQLVADGPDALAGRLAGLVGLHVPAILETVLLLRLDDAANAGETHGAL